jgi:hypothetical protein
MTIGRVDSTATTVSLMDLDQQLNLELAGDSGAEIAALLVLDARDSRNQAKAAEQAEERQLTQLEDEQVSHLYEQADATRSAGWARGVGLIVSGSATVIGAGLGADTGGAEGQTEAQSWAAAGSTLNGGLQFAASSYDYDANISGAQATDAGNKAKHVEHQLQQLAEQQSDAAQLARTALQAASDLSRAQTATDQATIFLRG